MLGAGWMARPGTDLWVGRLVRTYSTVNLGKEKGGKNREEKRENSHPRKNHNKNHAIASKQQGPKLKPKSDNRAMSNEQ